jgi:hypothetical protein
MQEHPGSCPRLYPATTIDWVKFGEAERNTNQVTVKEKLLENERN